ncbi:MAG: holo-ACP synthase [Alphaproteobacteria bacterium PA1]|nr:MAG: holo-ACP synthase [Alphaproteobacteria bacterium PA1]
MIVGIGSDLCRIDRIEATLARFGSRFEARCFTAGEQARANRRPAKRADTYAKRFAAKEACSKALGTGMRRGVAWRDMEVVNLPTGRPTLSLTGGALKRLQELIPPGFAADIHLSLSDDHPLAMAFVVIGLRPLEPN